MSDEKPAEQKPVLLGKRPRIRNREKYNAYMREYMRKKRGKAKE